MCPNPRAISILANVRLGVKRFRVAAEEKDEIDGVAVVAEHPDEFPALLEQTDGHLGVSRPLPPDQHFLPLPFFFFFMAYSLKL